MINGWHEDYNGLFWLVQVTLGLRATGQIILKTLLNTTMKGKHSTTSSISIILNSSGAYYFSFQDSVEMKHLPDKGCFGLHLY